RRRKDGSTVDISLTISPIIDRRGLVVGASKIARDISDRKVAETARLEEERVRETLAHIGAALASQLDRDKLLQTATDAAVSLTRAEFGAFVQANDEGSWDLATVSGAASLEGLQGFVEAHGAAFLNPVLRG